MFQGYIFLWRKIMETSFYKNPLCCHLAIHLLLIAKYKDEKFIFNGREIELKRGQAIVGRKSLSYETGLSEQTLRTNFKILSRCKFVTIRSTNRFSIVTMLKYNEYQQEFLKINHQINQPTNQQLTTVKEVKNKRITTMTKPTVQEIDQYAKSINANIKAETFFDFYESKGWVVGKSPMKDWRAAVRTWKRTETKQGEDSWIKKLVPMRQGN